MFSPVTGRNCLLSYSGIEYMGSISYGKNDTPCEYWNNTNLSIQKLTFISTINEILYGNPSAYSNHCRNVDNSLSGPWCFDKRNEKVQCIIPYCGQCNSPINKF